MSKNTNYQVIYVEFRLIPEHKYPANLMDALTATKHLIKDNVIYSIDLNNLVICGDSAGKLLNFMKLAAESKYFFCLLGGNLATVISQTLIEEKIAVPKLQVLIYPILQFFDFTLPSYRVSLNIEYVGI